MRQYTYEDALKLKQCPYTGEKRVLWVCLLGMTRPLEDLSVVPLPVLCAMSGLDEPAILSLLEEMRQEGRLLFGIATLLEDARVLVYAMDDTFDAGHTPSPPAPPTAPKDDTDQPANTEGSA
jgi:hypothetical protein